LIGCCLKLKRCLLCFTTLLRKITYLTIKIIGFVRFLKLKRSTIRRATFLISNSAISTIVELYSSLPRSSVRLAHVTALTSNSKKLRILRKLR
jgi:hypothetical protein